MNRCFPKNNRMIKTHTILVVLGISLLFFYTEASAKVIKMSYLELKPFFYLDQASGNAKGAVVDYFEVVASKMGYTVEWTGPLPPPPGRPNILKKENRLMGQLYILKPGNANPICTILNAHTI